MSFERFEKPGERFSTKISIWKQGVMHVSKGTMNFFALAGLDYCVLHYDRTLSRIGLQFSGTACAGSVRLSYRDAGAVIPAKTFFDYYSIKYNPSRQYTLELDAESGLLVIDLTAPIDEWQSHHDGDMVELAARSAHCFLDGRGIRLEAKETALLVRFLFEFGCYWNLNAQAMEDLLHSMLRQDNDIVERVGNNPVARKIFEFFAARDEFSAIHRPRSGQKEDPS